MRQPTAVEGVRTTTVARSFHVDPSITLDQNILGAQGELLFAAGTHVNPLDVVSLSRPLLFFDARDRRQGSPGPCADGPDSGPGQADPDGRVRTWT